MTEQIPQFEEGQTIDTAKYKDKDVTLHPEIFKWRDTLTVDLGLMRSLEDGQIQPIVFRLKDGKHELLVGSRRYFHQKLRGVAWEDILKDVRENVSERDALLMAASENIFRRDFNPWEEARAINSLLTKGKVSVKDLAGKLGKSQSYIASRRALLQLPKKIRKRFEEKNIPIGYASPLTKLEGMEEAQAALLEEIVDGMGRSYSGVRTIEAADTFVTRIKQQIKDHEELLAKYGPCPKCGSKNISKGYRDNQLTCDEDECGYAWHGETKEPWAYYELKQGAQELGIEIVEEEPGKMKLTPKDVADLIKKKERKEQQEREAAEEELPKNFRSKATLLMLLEPMIANDNIQKLEVRDEKIEIQLIEGMDLYFDGLRKDYADGVSKARIMTAGWGGTDSVKKNHDHVNKMTQAAE